MVQEKQETEMSSRDKILANIKNNQPELIPLSFSWTWPGNDRSVETFVRSLKSIGGEAVLVQQAASIEQEIIRIHGTNTKIVSTSPLLQWKDLAHDERYAEAMEQIDVAIVEGQIGVAENGAVWIDERAMSHRALPFICQHLVIIIREHSIVADMHEAYSKIDITSTGFGVFIAGPSKTADIEQSLVIGAHGARSLTVYIAQW